MIVNAVIKGCTVPMEIEREINYLGQEDQRMGFTQMTQTHVYVALPKMNRNLPG